jgi:cytochrome c oxidase subunit 2
MNKSKSTLLCGLSAILANTVIANFAYASEGESMFDFQTPNSPVMHDIKWFHDYILIPMEIIICLLILGLLIYAAIKFNAKSNPTPATFTHNVPLEIAWTAIPVLILLVISYFSFPLLYKADVTPAKYDITIKAIGNQWYWDYEYTDHEGLSLTANMLSDAEAKAQNKPRLLGTDNPVVVPVGKVVRVQVTAPGAGVLHAWAVPAFGVKIDAVPGRLNETWFKAERTGTFYGQCSEICGERHAFMPIEIKVVSEAEYNAWLASKKTAEVPSSIQFAQAN